MTDQEDSSSYFLQTPSRTASSFWRPAAGIFLIFLILMGGRLIRRHMLVGPDGQWRQHLWLDELVQSAETALAAEIPTKPRLTGPLPINTCSADSLTLLPGVGPVLADRIDAVRREGKVFRSAKDLELVKGIGRVLSARLGLLVVFSAADSSSAQADTLPQLEKLPANSQ